ncbi:MAG: DNA polymerase I [Actinomycetota bacterium]|nr:DNA polymerase I [Actinomycetota bacterium]
MAKLLLLDGHSLTYRAFFALPTDMATASGQVTNAVFGFTSMLINLLRDHQPDRIAVAFDRPEPTFRHAVVPTYKAQREEAPDILRQQLGLVRQVLEALGIPMIDAAGYEADDVIATLATQARDQGDDVIIVTGDRDTYQLVEDPLVKVLYNRRGVSDYVLYDEVGIRERTGVSPTEYPEYAAMRGDPSDNLPGVPGVGEKTAAKLITTHGGLDGIFSHLDTMTPKLRANLGEHEETVRRNAEVMVLLRDVPLEVGLTDLSRRPFDADAVRDLFNFLEFRTLYQRLSEAGASTGLPPAEEVATLECGVVEVGSAAEAVALFEHLVAEAPQRLGLVASFEGEPGRSPLTGLALATRVEPGEGAWVPAALLAGDDPTNDPSNEHAAVRQALARLLGPGGPPLVTHGAKALMRGLGPLGIDVHSLDLDTELAGYLLDPAESAYLLADLLLRYVGVGLEEATSPAAEGRLDLDGAGDVLPVQSARSAVAVARLAPAVGQALADQGLSRLYDEVERPLVRVLARMETTGVAVDIEYLRQLNAGLVSEAARLEGQIHQAAGEVFLVNSTPQLRAVLFDRLGLTPSKRTKTGFSTDASSLEKLRDQHPVIELLLRYREVEKLRSTYGEGLIAEVADDGRIHATFHQTVARTGRLSSDRPNLHNIPVRTEEGRRFRRAFVSAPGGALMVADYNQIELRVIAHLAEDPGLVEAFAAGRDIHTTTAARVFGVDDFDVSPAQRSKAKMVSYGLAYGMESYGLAQRLAIPVAEAQEIFDAYFVAFPRVRAYMEATVAEARQRGYTETLMGRRRPIPELSSSNYRIRQAGERQAMNAGIQGLAADIFKVALVAIDQRLESRGLRSRLVLQVHDEVILEVPADEHDDVAALVVGAMAGACDLSVPLEVNLSFGASWADAKS